MALRIILKDEDPALRKKCRPITVFDDKLKILAKDMLETMHAAKGVGLAASQIGIIKRIFVMNVGEGDIIVVNPKIVKQSGKQCEQEGCLSLPGRWGNVERPEQVTLEAQDENGKPFTLEATGLLAICICHESDHLDGVLFTDKIVGELVTDA